MHFENRNSFSEGGEMAPAPLHKEVEAKSMVMLVRRFSAALFACVVLVVGCPLYMAAQMDTATISGRIVDPSGQIIAGAKVELVDIERGTSVVAQTNHTGLYTFSSVRPGHYRIQVTAPGFKTVNLTSLTINTQDTLEQNFKLALGSVSESITVEAKATPVDVSGTVGTVVDQKLVTELPLNGRSFQALFQLTPGVVITPAGITDSGQFSVNGQRANANYFLVDGASANAGIATTFGSGQSFGGSLPALSALGGTNTLVSTEAVQEFAIQTSSYAPEFGRTPGAQVSIVTRSGTNEFHGNAFDYVRNDIFDANDWFANHNGLKRAPLRQNDFGGVFGGPVLHDKTFFFFSYEGLRLRQPTTGQSDVPTVAARSSAPPAIQPFFNAYPLPTGIDEGNGLAPGDYTFSNPSRLDATSIRLDHHFSQKLSIFGRYNRSSSETKLRGVNSRTLNTITDALQNLDTLTVGLTHVVSPSLAHDARFNWTHTTGSSSFVLDNFGGATPFAAAALLSQPFTTKTSEVIISLALIGQNPLLSTGRIVKNVQRQVNFLDNVSWQTHSHLLKFGLDYRRLTPQIIPDAYAQAALFLDIPSALTMQPLVGIIQANAAVNVTYSNYSLYGEDTWRPSARLNLTYGLRWDYNPAPSGRATDGLLPVSVQGINDLSTLSLAPAGTPLYHARANNFAPRVGIAYQLRNGAGRESVVRMGAGIFYDLGSGPAGAAFTSFPFSADKLTSGTFPFNATDSAPPPITTNPPYSAITAFPRDLRLPYTYQWNVSLAQSLGSSQTLTLGYVGAIGHSLLRQDRYLGEALPPAFSEVDFVNNSGFSKYNAFQAQFRRRTTKALDIIASYTLSHALDNISSDSQGAIPGQFINPRIDYAPADFDIRHTGTFAVDYELPRRGNSRLVKAIVGGWAVDSTMTARSSPPVDVFVERDIGFGSYDFRPDRVPAAPLYIRDGSAPAGTRINAAAFSVPTAARQGDLGRNALRGFPLVQLDLALRRRFRISERFGLQARVDAFNIFNHPNFSPETGFLGTVDSSGNFFPRSGFGVSPNMLAQGLAPDGSGSGFNPLYQLGGPRSLQMSLKLEF
jgi:hypothetical protein